VCVCSFVRLFVFAWSFPTSTDRVFLSLSLSLFLPSLAYPVFCQVLQLQNHFVLRVNDFLASIAVCPPLSSSSTWMEVFYHRMFVFEDIVTSKLANHYREVLTDYLFLLEDTTATRPGRLRAQSLLDYLSAHTTDPCCSLLGMRPSAEVDRFFRRFLPNRRRVTPAPGWPDYLPRDLAQEPDASLASVHSSNMFFPVGKQEYTVGSLVLCVRPCNGETVYAIVRKTSSDALGMYTARIVTDCETVTYVRRVSGVVCFLCVMLCGCFIFACSLCFAPLCYSGVCFLLRCSCSLLFVLRCSCFFRSSSAADAFVHWCLLEPSMLLFPFFSFSFVLSMLLFRFVLLRSSMFWILSLFFL
jgi:hypothetical protein